MTKTITISPLTRIEGHLSIHTEAEPVTEAGKTRYRIIQARCEGEMFRGFEQILRGRDPLDAQQITQRICGVCPISHGMASVRAQEMAYGIQPSHNGLRLQNLLWAANFLQSHITHFYVLSALDFLDVKAVLKYSGSDRTLKAIKAWVKASIERKEVFPAAPFLPRFEKADYVQDVGVNCQLLGHYAEALEIRRLSQEMAAVFGAKLPHSTALVPGGVTQVPTLERVISFRSRLQRVAEFIETIYLPDLLLMAGAFPRLWEAGRGYGDLLSFGQFDLDGRGAKMFAAGAFINGRLEKFNPALILEEIGASRFSSGTKLHPFRGETTPAPNRPGAYTWLKAPRYRGRPMEVGPLARVVTSYLSPEHRWVKDEVDATLQKLNLPFKKIFSVLGRHLCRGLEARWIVRQAERWLDELVLDESPATEFTLPEKAEGVGLVEAPRGALGHWLTIEKHRIKNYQCVVPTTWNCSPRDDAGVPGPVEKALEGLMIDEPDQPMDAARIVRSFDPCLACAIH